MRYFIGIFCFLQFTCLESSAYQQDPSIETLQQGGSGLITTEKKRSNYSGNHREHHDLMMFKERIQPHRIRTKTTSLRNTESQSRSSHHLPIFSTSFISYKNENLTEFIPSQIPTDSNTRLTTNPLHTLSSGYVVPYPPLYITNLTDSTVPIDVRLVHGATESLENSKRCLKTLVAISKQTASDFRQLMTGFHSSMTRARIQRARNVLQTTLMVEKYLSLVRERTINPLIELITKFEPIVMEWFHTWTGYLFGKRLVQLIPERIVGLRLENTTIEIYDNKIPLLPKISAVTPPSDAANIVLELLQQCRAVLDVYSRYLMILVKKQRQSMNHILSCLENRSSIPQEVTNCFNNEVSDLVLVEKVYQGALKTLSNHIEDAEIAMEGLKQKHSQLVRLFLAQ